MPVARSEHDGRVAFRLERFLQFLFGLLADFSFDGLTFAVLRVQERGQLLRFLLVVRQQKSQRFFGSRETTSGVEARSETKSDMFRAHRGADRGDLH